jgi:hypothetical protein
MAPIKSSRPRQIEEESDTRAPNLPIGPDHEDDMTNQGSGDGGNRMHPVTNKGPDHEDEDGDHGSQSPSDYWNLNQDDVPQDENEEDARNIEHEGEDEGNAEQTLVGALSASQVRCDRGLNKFPSGHFVITKVNEVGDPKQPPVSVNAWKTSVGKLVRENVPSTYRFWKGKKHEEKCIVLDNIKQNLWDIVMTKFVLPRDCNTGLVKSRTLSNLGLSFKIFKNRMWSQYGQKDKMSN